MHNEIINIALTRHQALVLFEYLASLDEEVTELKLDPAAQRVLRALEGELESKLVEIVLPNYTELVSEAKKKILS